MAIIRYTILVAEYRDRAYDVNVLLRKQPFKYQGIVGGVYIIQP